MAIFDNSTLLDFNRIVTQESQSDPNGLEIELVQQEELLQHEFVTVGINTDNIKDIRHVQLKGGKQATVALHSSGKASLYWNCKLISSSTETYEQFKYTKVQMNF